MSKDIYDVAIIGAGPAGSSAAFQLAAEGAHVVVLEKAVFPRYKTCGGGLTQRAVRLLPIDIRDIVERECRVAEVHLHDAGLHFVTRRDSPIVTMTMRDKLDEWLLKAAQDRGAEVRMASTVIDILCGPEEVQVVTSGSPLAARFAIAADGALSRTARILDPRSSTRSIPGLEAEIPVDSPLLERYASSARFDFGLIPNGYAWVFPKREHLSVGVLSARTPSVDLHPISSLGVRSGGIDLPTSLTQYLNLLGIEEPDQMERNGFVIPCRPRKRIVLNGRVLLTGDAGGFVDPLTGEGIRFALLSGQLAAEAILEGRFDRKTVGWAYRRLVSYRILPEIRTARLLARLTYHHPSLRTALFRRLGQEICEALTDVVMGQRTYRELLRDPATYWKVLRQFLRTPS